MLTALLRRIPVALLAGAFLLVPSALSARIVRIEITSRASLFDGKSFGKIGPYEQLKGFAYGELDPKDPKNSLITDIALAPVNARGMVEYRTTFTLRKPVNMSESDGVLFYNIVNRGGHGGVSPLQLGDPGDGLLYNRGQVILWSGWQGDMPIASLRGDTEGIDVPVARNPDGSSVVSPVWKRIQSGAASAPLNATPGREPASLDTSRAKLVSVVSETPSGVKTGVTAIPSADWAFADCRTTPFPGVPDPNFLCLRNGFNPSLLYELVYPAKDPLVLGVGLVAMRDVGSFFRYAAGDNPVTGSIRWMICHGESQSGRAAKEFLNLGFNQDENGRKVWDGLDAFIAGMTGGFNVRFAVPGDIAELYDPGADGPLWWADYKDDVRGHASWGLLHRCSATSTCPKIIEVYGGPEFWYTHGTVGIVGTAADRDLPVPATVRRYYNPGTPHGGGRGGFELTPTAATGPGRGAPGASGRGAAAVTGGPGRPGRGGPSTGAPSALLQNPNPLAETHRALFVALIDWVTRNVEPPPSVYPRLSDGTLVPANAAAMGWPAIPGMPTPDGVINPVLNYDYGPQFRFNDVSGVVTNVPPAIKGAVKMLAPKVDKDGNEIGGIRSLLMRMPLGTYTSWDPITAGALKGRERSLAAGYIPFARTKAERLAKGDPRLSLEERYPSLWQYVTDATKQANDMVQQRLLLPEDATRLIGQMVSQMTASQLLAK